MDGIGRSSSRLCCPPRGTATRRETASSPGGFGGDTEQASGAEDDAVGEALGDQILQATHAETNWEIGSGRHNRRIVSRRSEIRVTGPEPGSEAPSLSV